MTLDEGVDVFPGCQGCCFPFPLDEHMLHATGEAGVHCPLKLWNSRSMVDDRQRWRGIWRRADELLEKPHMEHIM
jgi:hypothetical protein